MKKVLLIEDNLAVRENTAEILELANYDVETAEDGKIGVVKARETQPDIIICDIMMPNLDGYGVLHMLMKDAKTAGIPFVFLTAKAEKSDMRKGMNLGADDYITKPFEEVELLDAIESRLNKNNRIKKEFENPESMFLHTGSESAIAELVSLTDGRKIRTYNKKETIYREGDFANYLFYILSGKVKSVKSDYYGKDLVTDLHAQGDFIGQYSLLEGNEYMETTSTLETSEIVLVPKEDFLSLVHKNRDVAYQFIKMLAGNVHEKEQRLLKLAYASVRERVADALLQYVERYNPNSEQVKIKISREDLANVAGTATESLIRTLSDFKEEKLISTSGSEIDIKDVEQLKRVAGMCL